MRAPRVDRKSDKQRGEGARGDRRRVMGCVRQTEVIRKQINESKTRNQKGCFIKPGRETSVATMTKNQKYLLCAHVSDDI